jgi:hypothetical protein
MSQVATMTAPSWKVMTAELVANSRHRVDLTERRPPVPIGDPLRDGVGWWSRRPDVA